MDSYLLLRCENPDVDVGVNGNLLLNRMVGAHCWTHSAKEYAAIGSVGLLEAASRNLKENQGVDAYCIPGTRAFFIFYLS
jgi:hypothetical protein